MVFAVFFLLEMLWRLKTDGCNEHFLTGKDVLWNLFDCVVTLSTIGSVIFEYARHTHNGRNVGGLVRALRLIRLSRLIRMLHMKSVKELHLIVQGLLGGVRTMFWAVLLLAFTVYLVAIALTMAVGKHCQDQTIADDNLFASVPRSMFTVFRCLFGDCTSSAGTPIVYKLSELYGLTFVLPYVAVIMFVTFGLFNLIFAIYVESTLAEAKSIEERDRTARYRESVRIARLTKQLLKMFSDAEEKHGTPIRRALSLRPVQCRSLDTQYEDSGPGSNFMPSLKISKELFLVVIQDPEVQKILNELDLPAERANLFDILDANGSGTIGALELLEGILKVRGQPRQSDIVGCLLAIRSLQLMTRKLSDQIVVLEKSAKVAFDTTCDPRASPRSTVEPDTTQL